MPKTKEKKNLKQAKQAAIEASRKFSGTKVYINKDGEDNFKVVNHKTINSVHCYRNGSEISI